MEQALSTQLMASSAWALKCESEAMQSLGAAERATAQVRAERKLMASREVLAEAADACAQVFQWDESPASLCPTSVRLLGACKRASCSPGPIRVHQLGAHAVRAADGDGVDVLELQEGSTTALSNIDRLQLRVCGLDAPEGGKQGVVAQVATLLMQGLVERGDLVIGRALQWLPNSRRGLDGPRVLCELWVGVCTDALGHELYITVAELLLVAGLAAPTPAGMLMDRELAEHLAASFTASVVASSDSALCQLPPDRAEEPRASRVHARLRELAQQPAVRTYFDSRHYLPRVDELQRCAVQPHSAPSFRCTLTPAGRVRLASLAASSLPTLTMQSLLLEGESAEVKGVQHPAAALRACHSSAANWQAHGCPWLYQVPPPPRRRCSVWMGDPAEAKC